MMGKHTVSILNISGIWCFLTVLGLLSVSGVKGGTCTRYQHCQDTGAVPTLVYIKQNPKQFSKKIEFCLYNTQAPTP